MNNRLKEICGAENFSASALLKDYTTFRVGGAPKALIQVTDISMLKAVISLLKECNEDFFIIGNGSNLLVSDKGYEGYVIKLSGDFNSIALKDDNRILAGAGAVLSRVSSFAKEHELTGLEFAQGIPGTVGGAMVMNAGAYDGEMSFVVSRVKMLTNDLEIKEYSNPEMQFGYRDSILKRECLYVLETEFKLEKGSLLSIDEKMKDFSKRRRDKQPLEYPSAGSTFKRPIGNFAGKLIEEAGLSGERVGGACVSTKHCGFIVNDKGATAEDINKLIEVVIRKVKDNSGYVLEPEVIRIGNF